MSRQDPGPHALRLLRDGGIGLLAVVYGLGFLAWSLHAINQGLGFLPLTVPHYISAGALVFVLVAGATGFQLVTDNVGHQILRRSRPAPGFRWFAAGAAVQASSKMVATVAVLWLALTASTSMRVFQLDESPILLFAALLSFTFGAAEGLILGLALGADAASASRPRTTLGGMLGPNALKHSEVRRTPRWVLSVGTSAMLLLVVSGSQLLPGTQPEFGGARPRTAVMEVDSGAFGPQTRQLLFQGGQNGTSDNDTAWTVPVLVYYYDEASFLVRPQQRGGPNDPLYEINRAIVYTVVWLD